MRRFAQTVLGTFLKCVKENVLPLVEHVEIGNALVAYSRSPHHHGLQLLAAVMDRWPLFSRFGSRKFPRFHSCLKGWRQLTQDLGPTVVPLLQMFVGRNRTFRNWNVYQDRSPRRVGPHGPALASTGQQAPDCTPRRKSGGENLKFRLPCRSNSVLDAN